MALIAPAQNIGGKHTIAPQTEIYRLGGKSPVGICKRVEALQTFMFSKQFLSYHTEGMKF